MLGDFGREIGVGFMGRWERENQVGIMDIWSGGEREKGVGKG